MALFAPARPPAYVALAPAHAEACATLHAASFAHGWSAVDFERLIAARSSFGDAAFAGTMLAGFILSRGAAGEAEVLTIAVATAWRRRGIGRGLLDRHRGRLVAAGCTTLFLEVGEDNTAAKRLYARTGFVEVGRRAAYYAPRPGQAPAAALVLRRALD